MEIVYDRYERTFLTLCTLRCTAFIAYSNFTKTILSFTYISHSISDFSLGEKFSRAIKKNRVIVGQCESAV